MWYLYIAVRVYVYWKLVDYETKIEQLFENISTTFSENIIILHQSNNRIDNNVGWNQLLINFLE